MSSFYNMEQTKEVQLAYHIARELDDLKSIDWHISICRKYPETFLLEKLEYVLSRGDISNPAAYYNSEIKRHGKYSRN